MIFISKPINIMFGTYLIFWIIEKGSILRNGSLNCFPMRFFFYFSFEADFHITLIASECIIESSLWDEFCYFKHASNMRIVDDLNQMFFRQFLLDMGNGTLPTYDNSKRLI
jgi:hypothetical protein